jgi:hypothetical protein
MWEFSNTLSVLSGQLKAGLKGPFLLLVDSCNKAALRCIFSTTGDYLRRMTHQHRRMPLTLCYR